MSAQASQQAVEELQCRVSEHEASSEDCGKAQQKLNDAEAKIATLRGEMSSAEMRKEHELEVAQSTGREDAERARAELAKVEQSMAHLEGLHEEAALDHRGLQMQYDLAAQAELACQEQLTKLENSEKAELALSDNERKAFETAFAEERQCQAELRNENEGSVHELEEVQRELSEAQANIVMVHGKLVATENRQANSEELHHELLEERRGANKLREENAGLERDVVDLMRMLKDLKAAVHQYAGAGTGPGAQESPTKSSPGHV